MNRNKPDLLKKEYSNRINRVIDYIESNLNQELSLEKLSEVAHFSTFHFHRIFRANVGETLNQFIQRLRLEKAANRLLENRDVSITQIAFDCGFSSSSSFARAFKEYYSISASRWREEKKVQKSKIGKTGSKTGKDIKPFPVYIDSDNQLNWRNIMKNNSDFEKPLNVKIKELSPMNVVYVRHIGHFKENSNLFKDLFTKIITWAGARGLLNFPETKVMAVYHDNPEITDENKRRTSLCLTVPEKSKEITQGDSEIGHMTLKGGKYAVAHFELENGDEFKAAWNGVYGLWLPQSGFQPDDGPPFEIYHNNPDEHPDRLEIVDICIPVKPL